VAALVTSDAWPARDRHARAGRLHGTARAAALCASAVVLGLTAFWVVPKYRSEETRRVARATIDKMAEAGVDVSGERAKLAEVRSQLEGAVGLDPENAQAWSDKAYADSLWALVNPRETAQLGAEVEREAARAVGLCPVIAEFWIRRGTGYDMQRQWLEGGNCMVRALLLAPDRADVWYYQAYHLSLASTEVGPAMAASEFCLRLDPSFLLAQALRKRLGARLE
jgi:hypothetical protein